MVWEVKHSRFIPRDEDGLPGEPMHLIAARDVLNAAETKFFVSDAPPEVPVSTLLLVAFSRWRVERCFEDEKGEIGLDHDEGRRYLGWRRHRIVSAVSHLFLAETRQERLTSPERLHKVANPFFLYQESDVAVSVASMENIAAGRKPALEVRPVACDHLSDFRDPAGLKALAEVLSGP
jgi:hypothetical protein